MTLESAQNQINQSSSVDPYPGAHLSIFTKSRSVLEPREKIVERLGAPFQIQRRSEASPPFLCHSIQPVTCKKFLPKTSSHVSWIRTLNLRRKASSLAIKRISFPITVQDGKGLAGKVGSGTQDSSQGSGNFAVCSSQRISAYYSSLTRIFCRRGNKADLAKRLVAAERTVLSPAAPTSDSVREFTSSARYNVEPNPAQSKFSPRRPYLLNVKLPEEPDEAEEGPIIVSTHFAPRSEGLRS